MVLGLDGQKKGPKSSKESTPPKAKAAKKATETAKQAGKKKVDQAKKKGKANPKINEGKDENKETKDTSKQLNEVLGAGFMYDLKKILFLWKKLWTEDLPGLGDKFENWSKANIPVNDIRKAANEAEKRITVPKLSKRKEELKTKLAVMKKTDSVVKYLYTSLGLEMPALDQVKQKDKKGKEIPVKAVTLKHLIKQLKDAKVGYLSGPKAIKEKTMQRPPYFYKGDLVVVTSATGKLTAGFIEAMDDNTIHIKNNTEPKPQKFYTNQLFLAFHFPGNKRKGNEVPRKVIEPKSKKPKET
ncbi:hypothetical protein ACFL3T_00970 [Patescibacteria group bacterium]